MANCNPSNLGDANDPAAQIFELSLISELWTSSSSWRFKIGLLARWNSNSWGSVVGLRAHLNRVLLRATGHHFSPPRS